MSVSLRRRWGEQWSVDAAAGFQQDLEELLTTELGPTTQLSKLKQVDGSGSGLDADLLDGHDSTYFAPLASPGLTGVPTAPTASPGTNTTQLATTAFVTAAVSAENTSGQTTPTPVPGSGAFGTVPNPPSSTVNYVKDGNQVSFNITIVIPANGTAATNIQLTLPYTATVAATFGGMRTETTTGVACMGVCPAGFSTLYVVKYDNTYPGASSGIITLSGVMYV